MRKYYYLISFVLLTLIFNGCSSSLYYQVYDTTLSDNLKVKEGLVRYEDLNCQINYNLWGNTGIMGFSFYNKTDKNIYINLEESFFIKNGVAYDYYQNKIFKSSKIKSSSNNDNKDNYVTTPHYQALISNKSKISYEYEVEKKVICIPPKTLKYIDEYNIVNEPYRSCSLLRFPDQRPTKKFKNREEYTEENSPLKFGNIITYSLDNSLSRSIKVDNEFTVKSIANYRSIDILIPEQVKFCNELSVIPNTISTFTPSIYSANRFYFQYSRGLRDQFKH